MLNIETVLDNLNAGFSEIISLVPDRFNFNDDTLNPNWNGFPHGSKVKVLPSGKVLWCGSSNASSIYVEAYSDYYYANNFLRFNADGTIDNTFGPVYFQNGNNGFVHDFAVQSDGKIIVVGTFTGNVNGVPCNHIVRLNPDGSVDETFIQGTGFIGNALAVAVLSDDTIIVGGRIADYDGHFCQYIAKLGVNGTFDSSFFDKVWGSTFDYFVFALTVTSDDHIYVGGNFTKRIAKLASDGTIDATFAGNIGTGFNDRVAAIAVQSNGKVLVGYWGTQFNSSAANKLVRLEADGTLDATFGTVGVNFEQYNNGPMDIAIQGDGKILVGGWFVSFDEEAQRFLARFNTDGTLDTTLDIANKFAYAGYAGPRINGVAVSGTDIFVAHSLYYYEDTKLYGISKLNSTGALQSGFNVPATSNIDLLCDGSGPLGMGMAFQPVNKLIYVCESNRYDGLKYIRRFNMDGTEDETFHLAQVSGMIRVVAVQSTGKIIIGGDFYNIDGIDSNYLARLNSDGTLDASFNMGNGPNGSVYAIEIGDDDKIWIGGNFSSFDSNSTNYVAQLNADGSFDVGTSESDLNNTVFCIKKDGSGNVYVGGRFTNQIMRLNSSGVKDGAFVSGGFTNGIGNNPRVSSIQLDSNGKVVIGHWFTYYNGIECSPGIVRLNTDGTIDDTFATEGTGLYDTNTRGLVQTVAIQGNGKILVGGWFDTYNGEPQKKLIRFNANGTKDTSFDVGDGFNVSYDSYNGTRIQSIIIDGLGGIYCAGNAYTYQNIPCYPITKLMGDGSRDFDFIAEPEVGFVGIEDGGNDMYDGANFINTNLTQPYATGKENNLFESLSIPVTHIPLYGGEGGTNFDFSVGSYIPVPTGKIKDGTPYFGSGSQYFTNMYEGMFVLGATDISINEFSVLGNIGADGGGTATSFEILANGNTYTVFMKNVFGSGDPSINQLIIVPGNGDGITQLYDESTDYDDHCLQGLNVDEIYYIVVSRNNNESLSSEGATALAAKFLEVIGASTAKTYRLHLGGGINAGYDAEGNMDTTVEGGVSLQRTGYLETVNAEGGRKVLELVDNESFTDTPQTLTDYFPATPN